MNGRGGHAALLTHLPRLGEALAASGAASEQAPVHELSVVVACAALHVRAAGAEPSVESVVALLAALGHDAFAARVAGLAAGRIGPVLEAVSDVDPALAVGGDHDPYEVLLEGLAPEVRRGRGVYYTPRPLVDAVVARVDMLLRDELGIERGLAETCSLADLRLDVPAELASAPAVGVLDPSAGTGAFLCGVVRRVHAAFCASARRRGHDAAETDRRWQAYVPASLLPRIAGVELSEWSAMVGRLRLALCLRATGYDGDALAALALVSGDALAAGRLDAHRAATVLVGNPPYARGSRGRGPHLDALMAAWKRDLDDERNLQPLADDYIRFLRLSEAHASRLPHAVVAMVTNHAYLSGRLHRRMRESLLASFARVDVIDLHGSTRAHRGAERDENVFPVAQGVAVTVLAKAPGLARGVTHTELRGRREDKLRRLGAGELAESTSLSPRPPLFLLSPRQGAPAEYEGLVPLPALFDFHGVGGKPGDDGLLVGFEPEALLRGVVARHGELASGGRAPRTEAERKLARWPNERPFSREQIVPYAYRPYDERFVFDAPEVWTRPVRELRSRLGPGPLLLTTRLVKDAEFAHVFASRTLPDVIFLSATSSVNCYVFPCAGLRPERLAGLPAHADQERTFAYLYALLHSRAYRQRYAQVLEHDFPRVAAVSDPSLFDELVARGEELLSLHLGTGSVPGQTRPRFDDAGGRRLERVGERGRGLLLDGDGVGRLRVNAGSYFEPISARAWEHRVGGYQVLYKWLADRRRVGRSLDEADVERFRDVVARIAATLACMDRIDRAIERVGGLTAALVVPGSRPTL